MQEEEVPYPSTIGKQYDSYFDLMTDVIHDIFERQKADSRCTAQTSSHLSESNLAETEIDQEVQAFRL